MTLPFIDYMNAVDDYMDKHYGVESSQRDVEVIAYAQENGDSPEGAAKYIAEIRKLKRRDNGIQM